jgi:hypothetical protein
MGRTCRTPGTAQKCIPDFWSKKPEGDTSLRRSMRRWEDNIKMEVEEIGYKCVPWTHMTHDMVQWRAFMNTVMNLPVP